MRSILEAFANDGILPNSRYFERGSQYSRTLNQVVDAEQKLTEALDEEKQKLLEEFSRAQGDLNFISGTDKFIYGYRLGVLMTMEVFNTRDDLVSGGERG